MNIPRSTIVAGGPSREGGVALRQALAVACLLMTTIGISVRSRPRRGGGEKPPLSSSTAPQKSAGGAKKAGVCKPTGLCPGNGVLNGASTCPPFGYPYFFLAHLFPDQYLHPSNAFTGLSTGKVST